VYIQYIHEGKPMNKPLKMRWVLAHVPYDLFLRSANIFAKKVYEKSQGQIEIEVLGADQYIDQYMSDDKVDTVEGVQFADLVDKGIVEMSQMYNTTLSHYNKDLRVLDMPYLFRDHDHAQKVLDGDLGLKMLGDLSETSNIRGLAFTYSGGFRMIVGDEPLSVDSLKGQKIRTSSSDAAIKTFEAVAADPVNVPIYKMTDALKEGIVDIGENTWARYFRTNLDTVKRCVTDTKHSLFLTAIIINKQIWESLTPEMQGWMQEAAIEAAQSERAESLEDNEAAIARCKAEGIPVIEWDDAEVAKFKELTQPVYEYFESQFPAGMISSIKATR
jgi:TRAP-type C4-dicarboxylate transport system substrate-binding protein